MAAANESQGLKIAVAAFVTLTVILAVTSYFLYSSYSRTEGLLQSETEKASKSERKASEAINQYEKFRELVGARGEEFDTAKAEVDAHVKKVNERLTGIANSINAHSPRPRGPVRKGRNSRRPNRRSSSSSPRTATNRTRTTSRPSIACSSCSKARP